MASTKQSRKSRAPKKSKVPKSKISQDKKSTASNSTTTINPLTKRTINIDGPTFRRLIKSGYSLVNNQMVLLKTSPFLFDGENTSLIPDIVSVIVTFLDLATALKYRTISFTWNKIICTPYVNTEICIQHAKSLAREPQTNERKKKIEQIMTKSVNKYEPYGGFFGAKLIHKLPKLPSEFFYCLCSLYMQEQCPEKFLATLVTSCMIHDKWEFVKIISMLNYKSINIGMFIHATNKYIRNETYTLTHMNVCLDKLVEFNANQYTTLGVLMYSIDEELVGSVDFNKYFDRIFCEDPSATQTFKTKGDVESYIKQNPVLFQKFKQHKTANWKFKNWVKEKLK